MKLSDCPHAVGTPEHRAWINQVYIPFEEATGRRERDRAQFGAESIGGRILDGDCYNPDGTERSLWFEKPGALSSSFYWLIFEPFEGIINLPEASGASYSRGGKKQRRPIPKKPERQCPRHGGLASNCRKCWR